MARKKGQTYTPEQKSKVVLELLKEEKTLSELATQYKVTPKTDVLPIFQTSSPKYYAAV